MSYVLRNCSEELEFRLDSSEQTSHSIFVVNLKSTSPICSMRLPEDAIYHMVENEYLQARSHTYHRPIMRSTPGYRSNIENSRPQAVRSLFASLCLVSRLFFRITQPYLYKMFYSEGSASRDDRLDLFLRTLLDRPDLAAQVREIDLESEDIELACRLDLIAYDHSEDTYSALSDELVSICLELTDIKMRRTHWEADNWENYEIVSELKHILLIKLCQNLQSIRFDCFAYYSACRWLNGLVEWYRMQSGQVPYSVQRGSWYEWTGYSVRLANLRQLTVRHIYTEDHELSSFWSLRSIMHLPRLQCLYVIRAEVYMCGLSTMPGAHVLDPSKMNNLTEIYIHESSWQAYSIEYLLAYSPHLRVLELIAVVYDDETGRDGSGCTDLKFPILGDALRQYGTSLVELTIDARGAYGYGILPDPEDSDTLRYDPLLGSLKALDRLHHLCVPLAQLSERPWPAADADPRCSSGATIDRCDLWQLSNRLREDVLPASIKRAVLLDHRPGFQHHELVLDFPAKLEA